MEIYFISDNIEVNFSIERHCHTGKHNCSFSSNSYISSNMFWL